MNEHIIYTEYKLQSEMVHQAKEKLKQLNARLLTVRKACVHEFKVGACVRCGQNQEVLTLLEAKDKL